MHYCHLKSSYSGVKFDEDSDFVLFLTNFIKIQIQLHLAQMIMQCIVGNEIISEKLLFLKKRTFYFNFDNYEKF
jgi:hypothetical protein